MTSLDDTTRSDMAQALRAAYAQSLMTAHLLEKFKVDNPEAEILPPHAMTIKEPSHAPQDGPQGNMPNGAGNKDEKICIVGAGAAGLAAAMDLHKAGFYNIEILEASAVAGGRMFTYDFPDIHDGCKHNYCDMGAMRIPQISRMKATFDLLDYLKITAVPYYYNLASDEGTTAKKDDAPQANKPTVPTMWFFGNSRPQSEAFTIELNQLLLDCGFLKESEKDEARVAGDFDAAFAKFKADGLDLFSTRSWLLSKRWTYEETILAELAVSGRNGSFDQALLETVCDWLDFQEASAGKWFRIEGGMKVLVQAMVDKVLSKPQTTIKYSTPVIALKNNDGNKTMSVTTEDGTTKEYDVVFNTTALACLQRMDIAQLGLPQKILTGIRSLHYDNSAKVAIKFKKAWWTGYLKSPGGVSASDLPISNIVYPSFDVADGEPAVLLASYAWSQDAIRLGSLFNNGQPGDKPNVDALIVTQVLKNIAEVWSKSGMENPPSYKDLRDMYIDHFAFSWDQDRYTGGAFALFGPGQFKDFYGPFQDPHCQGKFFICGEAISVEHAWISGALNSAYTATLKWVRQQDLKAKTKPDVTGQYKLKCSVFGGGEHQHPAEFNENILYWCVKLKDVVVEHDAATAPATAA